MSKNFLFKFCTVAAFLAVAILLLLRELNVLSFPARWLITGLAGVLGVLFILRGALSKSPTPIKKLNVFIGTGFIIVGVFSLIGNLITKNIAFPIIAIVAIAGLLLAILVTGGKSYDTADNEKAGYKDYRHRDK